MTLTQRLVKGSELTYQEGDDNLIYLDKKLTVSNTNPSVTDDVSGGFTVGINVWLNTETGTLFDVSDTTIGSAVWNEIHLGFDKNTSNVFSNMQSTTLVTLGSNTINFTSNSLELTLGSVLQVIAGTVPAGTTTVSNGVLTIHDSENIAGFTGIVWVGVIPTWDTGKVELGFKITGTLIEMWHVINK